jgi:SAM-dependent methyltransferase
MPLASRGSPSAAVDAPSPIAVKRELIERAHCLSLRADIRSWLRLYGISPGIARTALRNMPRYRREAAMFKAAMEQAGCDIPLGKPYPILNDYGDEAGAASGHYFHMDLWAARKIYRAAPRRHVDIGSRIDGFVAHLLTFRPVEVLDIRPLQADIEGLTFIQGDATSLAQVTDGAWESISCLHAAEHFGLGRYGDPIDPWGYRKLIGTLQRVLAPGGRLYFAVPIGRERVEFNAHRYFDPRRIISEFNGLKLVDFAAVDDKGDFVPRADPATFDEARDSCGLFEFAKA